MICAVPTTWPSHDEAIPPRGAAAVDVRIGVTDTPKEIDVDLGDDANAEAVASQIEESLAAGTGLLWLTDRRGRRVGVPVTKVAYVEIDATNDDRRVGFGSHVR
jgi:Protein of unknown function (DUF3107)